VITIPTMTVSELLVQGAPIKTLLISGDMVIELIMNVALVATPAPNRLTSLPGWLAGGKVGAEDANHPPFGYATEFAPPDPKPEGEGFA
jgi:hypothetical protein